MSDYEYNIEVKNLSTWFGKKQILKDVSCYFRDNTVTAIMGPSGCGKSTLLRTLNRLNDLVPSFRRSGHVLFRGVDIYGSGSSVYDLRKNIGMVFQRPNPFRSTFSAVHVHVSLLVCKGDGLGGESEAVGGVVLPGRGSSLHGLCHEDHRNRIAAIDHPS